jgi:hypothetical protein
LEKYSEKDSKFGHIAAGSVSDIKHDMDYLKKKRMLTEEAVNKSDRKYIKLVAKHEVKYE